MPKKFYKPSENIIQEWPEIFEDIYMSTVPVLYMHSVEIEFDDGRIWSINISEQLEKNDADSVAEKLVSAFHEYQEEIQNIVFKVDVEKLKNDVMNSTNSFLKRNQ
jgi:hypothetical protein